MDKSKQFWYVVQQENGTCQVSSFANKQKTPKHKQWGAYDSEQEAIAKKIGLIRAGQCQPE